MLQFKSEKLEKETLGFPMWLNYNDYYSHCLEAMRLLCREPYDLFSTEHHRNIHEAYKYLLANGAAPNEANIRQQLTKLDKWDDTMPELLEEMLWHGRGTMCMEAGMSGRQFMEFLLQDLRPLRWRRNFSEVISRAAGRIAQGGNEGNFREIALDLVAESQLAFVDNTEIKDGSPKSFAEAVNMALTEEEEARQLGMVDAITAGFWGLDSMSGGFKPGDLVVLAGRTSMGKTALALDIALNVAKQGPVVMVFSLEMTNAENVKRLFAKISLKTVGSLHDYLDKTPSGLKQVEDLPIFFDDSPATPTDIELRCDEITHTLPIGKRLGLIVVDHLQLLGIKDKRQYESRNRQLSTYTSELKTMAKRFGCVVLALSQVNRSSQREQRPPILSDLRESGTIEENADLVMGIYRPGVDRNNPSSSEAQLRVLKNRHGGIGDVDLYWTPHLARFTDT